MAEFNKVVIITQKTWLDNLIEKFNTKEQAKFYLEHNGIDFSQYREFHSTYYSVLKSIKRQIPVDIKFQIVEKEFLPNFLFNETDLVVVLGRDGLVVNTAKYLDGQEILAINPDPQTIDGVLLPFSVDQIRSQLDNILDDKESKISLTNAESIINENQNLYSVNDFFIGHKSHQSARYKIIYKGVEERHSSSGVIVSTGVGSTGWFKSILTGVLNLSSSYFGTTNLDLEQFDYKMPWDVSYLQFCVREPWVSKMSSAGIVYGQINNKNKLIIESEMPEGGVIFSVGIENDKLDFNSGSIVEIGISTKQVSLIVN